MRRAVAIAALWFTTPVHGGDDLGRLFTTLDQRSELDRPSVAAKRPPVTVRAVIRRTGADPVVLIGGEPVRPGQVTRTGVRVLAADETGVTVRLPRGGSPVRVVPGGTLPIVAVGPSP
ncbi:MAG: hypothetical protein WDA11_00770 [Thiohalomonadaceae bacterium]